ncbi:Carbohydrate esterase family 4 protein [Lasiodiplodia theobromae]|uniref:Carbohydrate esterase family 4 protein n=1 Tax=Lasiodiplodia theobromae TaxID=45133 RepID=UPI0015C36EF0|nr:Carbohydrate esterase family 4 protein [Lasiodiplodia theobromae]KAF4539939.1 Carbohydrate esterase family 4 protein [Lasiodiplodia theobromae]
MASVTLSWTSPNGTASANPSSSRNASATTTGKYPITTDNSCGASAGRMCLLTGVNPCCSSNGFCGGTDEYCGGGCQKDYGSCTPPNASLGMPECSWSGEGTSPRCDGRCGSAFNNSVCSTTAGPNDFAAFGVFEYGSCCSVGGFCGNSDAHCGRTCQSGCNGTNSETSSAAATVTVTTSATGVSSTGMASRVAVASSGGTVALALSLLGALLAI